MLCGRGPVRALSRFAALQSRDFRLLIAGQLVSLVGTHMQGVAVAWQLYQLTKSPLSLGALGLCRVLPVVLFALGGGVVADALDRRRLMVITQLALAASSLFLAVVTHLELASAWTIYGAALFAGTAVAFDAPARQSLVPELVPPEHLPNALALSATNWTVATVAGPAIGGLLLAQLGVAPIYLLDFLSFFGVIGALLAMRPLGAARKRTPVSLEAAREGLRFLRGAPLISSTMLLDFFATFFGGSLLLLPIFAEELLQVGAEGLGLLFAAQPLGAALAGLVLSSRPAIVHQGRVLLGSVAVYGLAVAAFGLSPWLPLSLLFLAISGAADTVSMVIRQTIRQTQTPDELRGRMTSVNMIFFMGGPQLGELEAGVVARFFGARVAVSSGGLLVLLVVLAARRLAPTLARHQHTPPS